LQAADGWIGESDGCSWKTLPVRSGLGSAPRLGHRPPARGCGGPRRRRDPPSSRFAGRREGSSATVTVRQQSQIDRQGDRRLFPRAWFSPAAVLRRCRRASAPKLARPPSSLPRRLGGGRGDRCGETVGRSSQRHGGLGDGRALPLPVAAGSRGHDHVPARRFPGRARPPRSIGDARRSRQRRSEHDSRDRGARGEGRAVDGRR